MTIHQAEAVRGTEVLPPLPALPAAFTGREHDVAELLGLLAPAADGGAPLGVMVTGLGGIGKTTLAVAAGRAALARGRFRGALFVDLRGYDETPMEAGQALDTLLRVLGVAAEQIPPELDARAALYRAELNRHDAGVLVVADNASSVGQIAPLYPGSGRHRLLVTSRDTLPGLDARLLVLDQLEPEAARDLLEAAVRVARNDDDRVGADPQGSSRVAELCGHLPLAIRLAAAQLVLDRHLRPAELAADLADAAGRLDLLSDGETGIRLSLDRSYRRLTVPQAELFRLLAFGPGPDISTEAAAALTGRQIRDVRARLAQLAGTALIRQSPEGGRWYLHDLVRAYALEQAERFPGPNAAARRRVLEYYAVVADAADDRVRALPAGPAAGLFGDRARALAWLLTERVNLVAAVQTAAATGHADIAAQLAPSIGPHLARWFRTDDTLTVTRAALEAAATLDLGSEAGAWNNLGLALHDVRRFTDAVEAFRKAGELARDLGDRGGEGSAHDNLGNALHQLRRFDEAIGAHERALAIFRELGDRRREAGSLNNLASTLQDVRRFAEVIELLERARDGYQDLDDRDGEAVVWTNLATALREVGRFDEAVEAHERSGALARELGDVRGEGRSLDALGSTLQELRRHDEAITTYERALVIFREIGDRHGEALSLGNLGLALRAVRRFEEAVDAHERALAIKSEFGDRHGEAGTCSNLGPALQELQRYDEAEAALRRSLKIFQELGDRHGEALALNNLGALLESTGRVEDAAEAHRQSLAAAHELGEPRLQSRSLNNLGSVLRVMDQPDAALDAHQAALAINQGLSDRFGEAEVWNNLGLDHDALERYEEAIDALSRSRDLCRELGDRHGEAVALVNLGGTLCERQRFAEAVASCREGIDHFRELGARRSEALAWHVLAAVLREAGDPAEAEAAEERGMAVLADLDAAAAGASATPAP
ncbi:tetratricopeptide repeat protein [Kitasatospora sp. NPDC004745]|uniref:tetratricopeptide repeat protein n=1 Tax=Kitasatospora sp. NPDC004745 TaxID=3364019 RepID=UPI0036A52B91